MLHRTRVKFCGITQYEDAAAAVALGVDALGFVFYGPSPRNIPVEQASAIIAKLPPLVCKVGLFVDAGIDTVRAVLDAVPIDVVQFHGNEAADECEQAGRPYIKAIRMAPEVDLHAASERYKSASALLLDAFVADAVGGTGLAFDWSRIPGSLPQPVILAGGLTTANVAAAIKAVRPYAVDVSSGIERSRGIKDPEKMKQFMIEVKSVER
jgi:phosphoribosylanthranilate isomerase